MYCQFAVITDKNFSFRLNIQPELVCTRARVLTSLDVYKSIYSIVRSEADVFDRMRIVREFGNVFIILLLAVPYQCDKVSGHTKNNLL